MPKWNFEDTSRVGLNCMAAGRVSAEAFRLYEAENHILALATTQPCYLQHNYLNGKYPSLRVCREAILTLISLKSIREKESLAKARPLVSSVSTAPPT